ncbi:twin-arginine translocation signal domain-containing protein [Aliivibrio fischeri]|uniref:twin-arginine translocation signal domain-containing protein n=1 Tax=Aliivibrio fischeri TaxID=668 RepID=UPI00080E0026|nr:twin-arginine translocation signal domain-containing protein [Aliivibrio fischeri]OCH46828.1 transcriptional initiation protein Tat [Aliivibrio fischeri]OED54106.1 transcriptional initiation protein Tat [Aliivibrio fischeri]
MSNKKTDLNRRNLLKGLATAAAAGSVAAAVSGTANANTVVETKNVEKKGDGYRETQHIRDYYDSL